MTFQISYALNLYALFMLLILLATIIIKKEDFKYSSRLLKTVIIMTSVILVIEILSWAWNEIDETYARILNYIFNMLFFMSGPVIVGIFSSYVDYMNFKDKKRLKRRWYYMQLVIFFAVLTIINFFTPIVFSISPENVYARESFMNVAFASVFLLILYMIFITFKNRHHLEKEVFFSVLVISLIPLIGGILQMIFYGLLIMWAFVGLAVVVAYIYTETVSNTKDYLTKLYTRLIMHEYLDRMLEINAEITLVLIDLDDFKDINDTYGHKEGDRVLVEFSNLLRQAVPEESMISRLGGDEFLVVIRSIGKKYLESFLIKLAEETAEHNRRQDKTEIRYSIGFSKREKGSTESIDDLFVQCDKAMYKEKALHKASVTTE